MPDTKTSALTTLAAKPDVADLVMIVDVSDTTMAASGTNKGNTYANFISGLLSTTSQIASSANAAASTPSLTTTGTLFTGGSATTTFPYWYGAVTGATAVTSFNVNGTFLGCNMPSGFTGNFISLHVNGASSPFLVNYQGNITNGGTINAGGTITTSGNFVSGSSVTFGATGSALWTTRGRLTSPADAQFLMQNNAASAIGVLYHGRPVSAKTSNYTVLYSDSNAMFTNAGAAGAVNFTLPTASAGLRYTFYIDAAQTLTVTAGASTTIRSQSSVTTAAGNISASTQGNTITICAISSTQWVAESIGGTWTFA